MRISDWSSDVCSSDLIQIFLDAAAFNMEVDPFIRRFLVEARAAQLPDGAYPIVVPQPQSFPAVVTAGWSEAGLILPCPLLQRYGDPHAIEAHRAPRQGWRSEEPGTSKLGGHRCRHLRVPAI